MEAVIFIGLQGAGKTTFYLEHFLETHEHISLDLLRTRHREQAVVMRCVETGLRFVIDNTNPTQVERRVYIQPAQKAAFRVVGFYFRSRFEECSRRNAARSGEFRIRPKGLLGTAARMQLPSWDEGFAELYYVWIDEHGQFVVEGWRDEAR